MKKTLSRLRNSFGRGKQKKTQANNKNNTPAKIASDGPVCYSFKSPRSIFHVEERHILKKECPLNSHYFSLSSEKASKQCQTL